jgi:uncharacterized protein
MSPSSTGPSAPVGAAERVQALDVLRGMALFGVFLMNMTGFARSDAIATEHQLLSLPTAGVDGALMAVLVWLVEDKANTLFAFLFGLGFYLQMERLTARGAEFERIYRRRLTVLLVLGLVHTFFVWNWDILHLYALAGFALFALRKVSDRALLAGGLLLALFGRVAQEALMEFAGLDNLHGWPSPYTEESTLARQQLSVAGDYVGLVRAFTEYTYLDYIINGALAGWLLYALGRFMLGAWVGRRRWLQRSADFLPGFRRVMHAALPLGLLLEGVAAIVYVYGEGERLWDWSHWKFVAVSIHLVSVPLLAAGYLCAIVVMLHSARAGRWLRPFAFIGRMALTNYVAQSLCIAFVLFGVGPGLALAGHIGTVAATAVVIVVYAAQGFISRWWLSRFRFGPLEWVWRVLTYGSLKDVATPARVPGV